MRKTQQTRGSIPGVDIGTLEGAAEAGLDRVPIGSFNEPERLFGNVLRYMQNWYSAGASSLNKRTGYTAFVCPDYPRFAAEAFGAECKQVRVFLSNSTRELEGTILLTTPDLNDVHALSIDVDSVEGLAELVSDYGLGLFPCSIVDLAKQEAWLFPDGCDSESTMQRSPILPPEAELTKKTIETFLDVFYEATLNPSEHFGLAVWKDRDHGVPAKDVEKMIQRIMLMQAYVYFRGFFTTFTEAPTHAGRVDVIISRRKKHGPGTAILELKVLRSRYHTDKSWKKAKVCRKNEEWIIKGVDQVDQYRRQLEADLAFICCYDLQDSDSADLEAKCSVVASKHDVVLKRYFVVRTSEAWRKQQRNSAYAEWLSSN